MVVFREGEPDKSSYRRYRIRWAEGQDDFAMMREVITRRCRHVAERSGDEFEKELPALIVVDGGRPQLSAALEALSELGLRPHNIAALAKERTVGGERVKHERVYLPGRAAPIELPEHSYGFRLITRIRDEAHRFAISYHRKVRAKEQMKSPLTDVPGVGPKLARRLMERFGGLDKVSAASVEELRAVKGISERVARAIKEHSAKLTNRPPVSPA
jgi:excinuclease ABC subunit C